MYNIKLEEYVPEPKPAKSDYIVAAHYYPAWKKGAAKLHNAFDDLANYDFPERTPLCGYYDEENPIHCDWEIKWAVEHGINCFIYCWYRNKENEGKPVTVNDLRCGHGIHEALFHARYQKMINFALMFECTQRWGAAESEQDLLENLMPFWLEEYFKKDNYLKIDNKPVLFVYDRFTHQLEGKLGGPAGQKAAFDKCRELCKRHGFDGMIFAACNKDMTEQGKRTYAENGYDFRFVYGVSYYGKSYPDYEFIKKHHIEFNRNLLMQEPKKFVSTVSCFYDTTPRLVTISDANYSTDGNWLYAPEDFREVLRENRKMCELLPEDSYGRKMIMIDNWNEWDEGHFVSPSHKFGFQFLQAIREELTHRNNLPDYRTPQDTGWGDFNQHWQTPDFGELCEKRLNGEVERKF